MSAYPIVHSDTDYAGQTATFQSSIYDVREIAIIVVALDISIDSGSTGTLTPSFQWNASPTGADTWASDTVYGRGAAFATAENLNLGAFTAAGTAHVRFVPYGPGFRINYAYGAGDRAFSVVEHISLIPYNVVD